jgi:hypothetical protein
MLCTLKSPPVLTKFPPFIWKWELEVNIDVAGSVRRLSAGILQAVQTNRARSFYSANSTLYHVSTLFRCPHGQCRVYPVQIRSGAAVEKPNDKQECARFALTMKFKSDQPATNTGK